MIASSRFNTKLDSAAYAASSVAPNPSLPSARALAASTSPQPPDARYKTAKLSHAPQTIPPLRVSARAPAPAGTHTPIARSPTGAFAHQPLAHLARGFQYNVVHQAQRLRRVGHDSRTTYVSRVGESKFTMPGGATVRFQYVYKLRRQTPRPCRPHSPCRPTTPATAPAADTASPMARRPFTSNPDTASA